MAIAFFSRINYRILDKSHIAYRRTYARIGSTKGISRMAHSVTSTHRVEQLERLVETSRILSSTHDLPKLLQAIVDVACELTESEAASILMYDPKSRDLRFKAAPGYQYENLSSISVPLESSVAGWIFRTCQPIVIQNAARDPRIYRNVDKVLKFKTKSLIGIPLKIKDKPIGVIEAINKKSSGYYTENDLAILETLAGQATIAIENAQLMNQLREANTELLRLDKLKSNFIAIASHELRTPLGLILGHATFLKEYTPKEHQEQVDVIIRSAMNLKNIIEDLSTIAHNEQGQSRVRRATFSISQHVIDTVKRFMKMAHEEKIELNYDVPENDPLMIEADKDKISIVLTNLIRNALAFTDANGQVGIKAEADSGYVKVYVVDTGIGVPKTDQEKIFDRFYQVESHLTRRHGGMGLGLSIAKAMVELHNGQIWCESKEGTGSLFCFMLPINESQAQAAGRVFKNVK